MILSLYGFLRAITLILCLFTDFIIAQSLVILAKLIGKEGFWCLIQNYKISWASVTVVIVLWFSTIIAYFGYIKFLRRFTLENYMTLLSYKKL